MTVIQNLKLFCLKDGILYRTQKLSYRLVFLRLDYYQVQIVDKIITVCEVMKI